MEEFPIELRFVDRTTSMQELGADLADLLVRSKLAHTKSDARRQITAGAVRVGDLQVTDPFARLMLADNKVLIIQRHP
jgi:tyrosyl-tRNA synthetase